MRVRALSAVGLLLVSSSAHAVPQHLWSKTFGDGHNTYYETTQYGYAVATDGSGNIVIVCGSFSNGSIDFGGGPLTGSLYIAKLDPAGGHLWSKSFGDFVTGHSVAVDAYDDIIVVGEFSDVVNFGGPPLTSSFGDTDFFVVKFDADGNHVWSKSAGDPETQVGRSVAVDGDDNVIVSGYFQGSMDLGGGGPTVLTSAGNWDIFLGKYDPSGNYVWSKSYGDVVDQLSYGVDCDLSGKIVMTGEFESEVDFGGGVLTSASFFDIFVVKLDADGNHVWSNRYGGAGLQRGYSVVIGRLGSVLITGEFDGSLDFGGDAFTSTAVDMFVAKFGSNGNHLWSHNFGGEYNQSGRSIAADLLGNAAVIGTHSGTIFVRLFDADGNVLWSPSFGSPVYADGRGIAFDNSKHLIITGDFEGTVDFGGGPLTSPVFSDIFLAKFDSQPPLPVLITTFEAKAIGAAIEIHWALWSDESLNNFTLYRREDSEPLANVIAEGRVDASTHSYIDAAVEPAKTYHYELVIHTRAGSEVRSPLATATAHALHALLGQNHPNPFNPTTSIDYTLGERASAIMDIYDAAGALVVRLDQGLQDAGTHHVEWDGRDANGHLVGSGVYFYRLAGLPGVAPKKMVLLK